MTFPKIFNMRPKKMHTACPIKNDNCIEVASIKKEKTCDTLSLKKGVGMTLMKVW